MKVAFLGDKNDREVTALAGEELGRQNIETIDFAGRLSLMESASVIKRASIILTNDSGLMHMADALGRPLVAVFGPTSRELGFYPLGERARIVELEGLGCRPCTLHGGPECPEGHHRCMEEVDVGRVVEAARGVIGST